MCIYPRGPNFSDGVGWGGVAITFKLSTLAHGRDATEHENKEIT